MILKNKHNKKRNTAFLYETLIRELTKSVVKKENEKRQEIVAVLKEFFSNSSILSKELQLYKSLLEKDTETQEACKQLVFETYIAFNSLDRKKVYNTQTKLISLMSKKFGKSIFQNFVPNYRNMATISQYFSSDTPKTKIILERKIVEDLTSAEQEKEQLKPIDKLTYKVFVKNFNEKYSNLLKEQQELLNHYISSFVDNGIEMKIYVNEELSRIKDVLQEYSQETKSEDHTSKINEVSSIIEDFSKNPINEQSITQILRFQELVREIENVN
jgi:hypothetical protein